jgi:hypothetical protein
LGKNEFPKLLERRSRHQEYLQLLYSRSVNADSLALKRSRAGSDMSE